MSAARVRPLLAGQRPSPAVAAGHATLHLSLLSNLQSIVNLDPEIPDGVFKSGIGECVP